MVLCAPTNDQADAAARESFEWYPTAGARLIGSVAEWMEEKEQALGTYDYAGAAKKLDDDGMLDLLTSSIVRDSGSAVVGDPERCVEMAKRYEAVGRRPAALPGQPLQDPPRGGHADHRAHGRARHPPVQR